MSAKALKILEIVHQNAMIMYFSLHDEFLSCSMVFCKKYNGAIRLNAASYYSPSSSPSVLDVSLIQSEYT